MGNKRKIIIPAISVVGIVIIAGLIWLNWGGVKTVLNTTSQNDSAFDLPANPDAPGWTQTSGPVGGTVIRMIPYGKTVWASLYSGGIYELEQDNSWKQIAVGRGIPEVRAFDIIVDPANPKTVYVPERIRCVGKTTNGGASWQGLCDKMQKAMGNPEAPDFSTATLALDPDNSNILYVPGNMHDGTNILLVSKDNGETWEKRFTFNIAGDLNHLLFFNGKMYLSSNEDGVFVSSDKGMSWKPLNTGLEKITASRFVIFNNALYLLGALIKNNIREGGPLYRLASRGLSWEKISGLEQVTGLATDGARLLAGTMDGKLWTSTDGKSLKEQSSQGLPSPNWIGEIATLDSKIYVGVGNEGVYVSSDNGRTFQELNKGMTSIATREVHVNPKDKNEIYVGTWDRLGFYWSKNGGRTYKRIATDNYILTLQPNPQDFSQLYFAGDRFFSGRIPADFVEKNKPGSPGTFIKSIGIDPNNFNHVLVGVAKEMAETPGGEGLWESKDGGESWMRAEGIGNSAVYSILFNPRDPRTVYASALNAGVFKSTDGGSHFQQIGGEKLKYTYRLAMSPANPDVLVASSNLFFAQLSNLDQISGKYGGIFQTMDGGKTWKDVTAGVKNYWDDGGREGDFLGWLWNFGHMPNYEVVLIDPKDQDHLIVGHHGESVVETRDGGITWEKPGAGEMVPGGIHNYAYCLGNSADFKKIYACTCGRGLFGGLMDDKGDISWNVIGTVHAEESTPNFYAHNAEEARRFILSGEYNHRH